MKVSPIEVKYIDHSGSDLSVVNAARVSFHKESDWDHETFTYELKSQDAKLIHYLAKHKHISPFNHCFLTVRVKAPIFVARQLVKHKFMPWNEVSRRYVDEEPEFWFPFVWRGRPVNSKQGSDGVVEDFPYAGIDWMTPENVAQYALDTYNGLLEAGVAPEQARMVLPQNTMTEWIWSGTLGAWASMLKLRLDPHAQAESQIVAKKCEEIVGHYYPVSLKALLEYA